MSRVTLGDNKIAPNVRSVTSIIEDEQLLFTFGDFHLKPINIDGEFNNFYSSKDDYIDKISLLLDKALPLLSKEKATLFTKEYKKADALHLHRVNQKREIVTEVLEKYGFSSEAIDNIFEGENVYQLEVPYVNGSMRVVFQRIDNLISFLFVDPNHHIYFNPKKVAAAGSLYFEYCPVNAEKGCPRLDDVGTCYAYQYLDEDKYMASFGCVYDPVKE
jgi:hypothetical protein